MNEQVAHHPALVGWTSAQPVIRANQIERVQERAFRVDEVLANGSCAIDRRHARRLALVRPAVNRQPWHGICLMPSRSRAERPGWVGSIEMRRSLEKCLFLRGSFSV